jgi:hypothetical protein
MGRIDAGIDDGNHDATAIGTLRIDVLCANLVKPVYAESVNAIRKTGIKLWIAREISGRMLGSQRVGSRQATAATATATATATASTSGKHKQHKDRGAARDFTNRAHRTTFLHNQKTQRV